MIIDSTITKLSHAMSSKNVIIDLTVNCSWAPDENGWKAWSQECLSVDNGSSYTYTTTENSESEFEQHWCIDYSATE